MGICSGFRITRAKMLLVAFVIVTVVESNAAMISENDAVVDVQAADNRQLKCFQCDRRRTGYDTDEWFYKCLYPQVEDIGHEFNGTMMLDDCWSVPGGRCWVKVDTVKSDQGSRYDIQHISRGCTVEANKEADYCSINIDSTTNAITITITITTTTTTTTTIIVTITT